ncbi:MAG: ribbon-helix-helix protein, CopG family, partial [Bryobacteraceae bacterium]
PELGTGRGVRLYETEPKYAPERCTPEYAERLERLRRKSGVASYAEVVRDALKRHDQIEQVMSSGDKLVVEKADGTKILLML